MKDKIVTVFRTRACQKGKNICDTLKSSNIDQEGIQVVYINEAPDISTFFQIRESPTVLLFQDAEEVIRYTENISTNTIIDFLKN